MRNSLLGFTPENFLKLEVFPSESSSPHRGTETGYIISLSNKGLAPCIFLGALKFSTVIINDASDKKSSVKLTKEGYTQNLSTSSKFSLANGNL